MGFEQGDSVSDLGLDVVGNVVAHRSARRSRSILERLYERDEPVSLERENEVGERRSLQSRRKKWPLAAGGPVHYQRAAERKWKRCAQSGFLESVRGHDRQRGHVVVRHPGCLFNGCRKQNVVLESEQGLRETL